MICKGHNCELIKTFPFSHFMKRRSFARVFFIVPQTSKIRNRKWISFTPFSKTSMNEWIKFPENLGWRNLLRAKILIVLFFVLLYGVILLLLLFFRSMSAEEIPARLFSYSYCIFLLHISQSGRQSIASAFLFSPDHWDWARILVANECL